MSEYTVREAHENDTLARHAILDSATRELRRVYRPRKQVSRCQATPTGILVAMDRDIVIGTAEYIVRVDHIYIQGIAVHPERRGQGICRLLLVKLEALAQVNKLSAVTLCAIEETGNVKIFQKLGFMVTNRKEASEHVGPDGAKVTQVDMERRIVK